MDISQPASPPKADAATGSRPRRRGRGKTPSPVRHPCRDAWCFAGVSGGSARSARSTTGNPAALRAEDASGKVSRPLRRCPLLVQPIPPAKQMKTESPRRTAFSIIAILSSVLMVASALAAPPSNSPMKAMEPPGTIIIIGKEVQAPNLSIGYAWDRKAPNAREIFSGYRSSLVGQRGDIDAIAIARSGQQFYLNKSGMAIGAARTSQQEKLFFKHTTYNRDVVLDEQDFAYFSESSGAREDGKIFKITPRTGGPSAKAGLFYTVPLADVGGFWAGPFAFGRNATGELVTDTLYFASGNSVPASIYRVTRQNGEWGKPEKLFQTNMSIDSLTVTGPNECYFVSGNKAQVFRLTDWTTSEPVLNFPGTVLRGLTVVPPR